MRVDCCVGHVYVVVVRSPAAVLPPHYTVTTDAKAGGWTVAALVLLLVYCCCTIMHCFCGDEAVRLIFQNSQPLFLIVMCAFGGTQPTHTYTEAHTLAQGSTVSGRHKGLLLLLLRRSRPQRA